MTKKKTLLLIAASALIICVCIYFVFLKEEKYCSKKPKNIILIIFDAVRSDRTTPYGCAENTTPFLDKLAKRGVIFKNAYAQASMTLYSTASTITGMYPAFHGLVTYQGFLKKDLLTLAEALRNNGYACFGFVNNPWLESGKHFNQGFNHYVLMKDDEVTRNALSILNPYNINLIAIKNRNKLKIFDAEKKHTDIVKKIRKSEKCTTGNGYEISFEPGSSNSVEIARTAEHLKQTEIFWGASLKADKDCQATLILTIRDDEIGSERIISKQDIKITAYWQSFQFKNKLVDLKSSNIFISFNKNNAESSGKIYIDDIFLFPERIAHKQKPKFLYLHYLMPHSPHRIPPDYKIDPSLTANPHLTGKRYISEALTDSFFINNVKYLPQAPLFNTWKKYSDDILRHLTNYNHQIRSCDDQLKKIVDYLQKTGQLNDSLLIITADHGEEFLDHGFLDHAFTSYVECLRVPLIMFYPACLPSGVKIEENAALIDIYPTIMNIIKPSNETLKTLKTQVQGKSLLPVIFGKKDISERIIFSTFYKVKQITAFYKNWKLIDLDSQCLQMRLLFNLNKDPYEKSPVNEKNSEILSQLTAAVQNYKQSIKYLEKTRAEKISSNSALLDTLARLGYIEVEKQSKEDIADIYCMYRYYSRFFLMMLKNIPI